MDASVVLKVAGVGILVAIASQLLSRSGREDMGVLVSVAGIIIVLFLLIDKVSDLVETIKTVFEQ